MSVEGIPSTPLGVSLWRRALSTGRWLSFWTAVSLPFVSVALLASGIETPRETAAFVVLVTANVAALIGGRRHGRR